MKFLVTKIKQESMLTASMKFHTMSNNWEQSYISPFFPQIEIKSEVWKSLYKLDSWDNILFPNMKYHWISNHPIFNK